VEIGYNQSHAVREIFQKEGYGDIILSPDYNRVERVLTARIQ
jgi:methylase of polypeptide subunit release factors